MTDKRFSWQSGHFDRQDTFFRLINSEDYFKHGIDVRDVPMGTFASEDHPSFLPSRFGGNAYGLGLIEQSVLNDEDTEFLESLDLQDIQVLGDNAGRLNAIYRKLGLLIRFSATGKRYFLIPINLVAHSLQEIKTKADEIEELIIQHIFETRTDRLDIGILTSSHDLIVHELTARLSSHRIFLFDSLERLRSWRMPLDIIILPKDPFEYLLEQPFPKASKKSMTRRRLCDYAMYLAGKIFDLLEKNGKIHVLAHSSSPEEDRDCKVRFKSEEELKLFLLFAHTFKTRARYEAESAETEMTVHVSDLHYYLNRFAFFEPHLKKLLDHRKPEELSVAEINRLPNLNLHLPQTYMKSPEKHWKWIFEPYFSVQYLQRKSPGSHHRYWQERLEIDTEMPESLFVFVGKPKRPAVTLAALEEEIKASGMMGCSLPLVAEYRKTFRYVLDVLNIVAQIRDHKFLRLSELERTRLCNPFRGQNERFAPVVKLLSQVSRLERIRNILNPDGIEGFSTPILENIPKLSLHGFSPAQLRELLLIVVGYTSMGRIVFGKHPARTLKPITDRARAGNHQESLELLRICRLMSMAEIIAALGDAFTGEQAKELYRLYADAINVATDRSLDWDRLHDLRISALGGVQNQAVREMMKIFNLFDFLDDWQDCLRKGTFQKEVICDYEPDQLFKMEETFQLARIAEQFKQEFMGDGILGQSYFFRQFLETEFHGTGHLFRTLGTRAGFILLWIAVNSSERRVVNFNPMLAGVPRDRHEPRVRKIRESLLRIPIERLQPRFFDEIKGALAEGRPAFVFDSGIRIMSHRDTRVVDISFVDVDENIQQLETLLAHFESRKLRGVSLHNLREMERRFSELESFHQYLEREGCYLQCEVNERPGGLEGRNREIVAVEDRLKRIMQSQIFIPEEIFDSISVLAQHCPEILRFALPEFQALGNLVESWPTRTARSLGAYVMRCLEKFQALAIKDRNSYQDRNTFYQLAKQEFGPLAEEGIGATHAQMETLEFYIDRIREKPAIYQALTMALLFQEIGKLDQYASIPGGPLWTHAGQGAMVLERTDILKKYRLDPQVEQMTVLLVRHHGIVGHVLRGEEPITSLERIISRQDARVFDVFVLHSIISAAAVQEGLMVSDLLDGFLNLRALGLQIIKSKISWQAAIKDFFREKGAAVPEDSRFNTQQTPLELPEHLRHLGSADGADTDEPLRHGRQIAALERLLKLVGATWVDYQDLQMFFLKMPVNFIYHKKKLKSVGLATFETQLRAGLALLDAVSSLEPEVRYYLLACLDHLGARMRVYDFHPLAGFLEVEDSLKLLILAFQAFHRRFGTETKDGLVSFRPLSRLVERRHDALLRILRGMPMPVRCLEKGQPAHGAENDYGELLFEASDLEPAVRVDYRDTIRFDMLVDSLRNLWDHEELARHYQHLSEVLEERLPFDTENFQEELRKVFEEQEQRINDRILNQFEEKLGGASTFRECGEIRNEMLHRQAEVNFSDEQRLLLDEIFEFHRTRLREKYLDTVYKEINALNTGESLTDYWNREKYELFSYRQFVGKEYESLIARFIDEKIAALEEE